MGWTLERNDRAGESGVEHAQGLGGDTVWDAWTSDSSEETFDFGMEMVLCAAAYRAWSLREGSSRDSSREAMALIRSSNTERR